MVVDLQMNPYLFGSVILLIVWAVMLAYLIVRRRNEDLREFWWGSGTCALLGFSEPLFVPEYWSPPSVLSFHRWDLESFIFCFAVGGITAVAPELPRARRVFYELDYSIWQFAQRLSELTRLWLTGARDPEPLRAKFSELRLTKPELRRENMLLVAFLLGTFGATGHLKLNIIYDTSLTCAAVACFVGWRTPRLRWQIWGGGLAFLAIYTAVLSLVALIYPNFYVQHWNLAQLSGRWLLGAPIEEHLFAVTLGVFWAPLYETWRSERDAPVPRA